MDLTVWDGQAPVQVTGAGVWDGAAVIDSTTALMPTGYRSVSAALAGTCWVAHRGGSLAWPEGSLRAYTQAVYRGYGALELSLSRTVDGVWLTCHDGYLDRTSLGTATTTLQVSAMTWDHVRAYAILPPRPGLDLAPYMRLDDYIETYADHAVTFVDPKLVPAVHYGELLAVMDAHGGPDRWIAKYYGKSFDWAHAARARGYLTWGYFYGGDGPTLDEWSDRWDLLGLDYGAPASDWARFIATGKPVLGHICPDRAAVDVALGHDAAGLMVSGTHVITPD